MNLFYKVKLRHLTFILIILLFNNYTSSQEIKKFIIQDKRIEFEFKFLDRNYWAIKNNNNIIVVNDFETGNALIWKFKFLDSNLKLYDEDEIIIDRSYRMVNHFDAIDKVFFLFKKDYSSDKEYKIIILNTVDNSFKEYQINIPFSLKANQLKNIGENIILSGKSNQNRSIVILYKTTTNQLTILSGFYQLDQEVLDIAIDSNQNIFKIIYLSKSPNNESHLINKTYSKQGDEISEIIIKSKNYSIIDGKFFKISNNKFIVIGTYGKKKSKYTRGLFFSKIEDNKQNFIKYYDYSRVSNFFYYLKDKKEEKIKKKIDKKRNLNKNIKLNYNLIIDEIIKSDSIFLISGESYFEEYNERGLYPTLTFYNSYSGNYDRTLDPNFNGYNHTHAIIVGFDINGKIIWDNSIELNDIISIEEKKYVKVNLNNQSKKIFLLYFHKGIIKLKLIHQNKNLFDKSSIELSALNKQDIIQESEKIMEGFQHWYENNYFAYGIQKIKNKKDKDVKLNRRVFYINKIQLLN